MRILYVSQYFPPEMGAPSARVHELSREWVKRGHQVTVLTAFANHPTGVKAPGDRWKLTRRENKDGIEVIRTYIFATPNKGILKRMVSYVSFMKSAFIVGSIRISRPDIVVATSPQLLCACAGYLLSLRFRRPFVFEVRDLWPESILAVEAMRENLVVRLLKNIAGFLYGKSRLIITVGEGYRHQIMERYGVSGGKIRTIPNGIDTGVFIPGAAQNPARKKWNWSNKKVVLYMGTIGMAHGLKTALETARLLEKQKDLLFAFVGEGAEKDKLKALALEWKLGNVQFIDQQPKDEVVGLYAACDLGLVMLRNTPLFQDVLPSKIFEYLAMEKPVVIAVGGEARKLVEAAGAGVYVPPENPTALAKTIKKLLVQPAVLKRMGKEGRRYVLKHFDRKILAGEYLEILKNLKDNVGADTKEI